MSWKSRFLTGSWGLKISKSKFGLWLIKQRKPRIGIWSQLISCSMSWRSRLSCLKNFKVSSMRREKNMKKKPLISEKLTMSSLLRNFALKNSLKLIRSSSSNMKLKSSFGMKRWRRIISSRKLLPGEKSTTNLKSSRNPEFLSSN